MSSQPDPAFEFAGSSTSRETLLAEINRLHAENVELKQQQQQVFLYIRQKVDQMLGVIGTIPLKPEELDDETLIELDPIGIISNSFAQIVEHLHETNEELQITHDELQAIFDSAPIGIIVLDVKLQILTCNQNAEKYLMQECTDVIGQKCHKAICQKESFPDDCICLSVLRGGATCQKRGWLIKDRYYDVIGTPLLNVGGEVSSVVLVYVDVTTQRRLGQEMARTLKLESLGLLAGGLAHDFNNSLAAILQNVTLARLHSDPVGKVKNWLEKTENAAFKAQHLTKQLLTFAKGGMPVVQEVAIDKLVRETASFALSGSNVQCVFSIPQDLWPTRVDPGQIDQVVRNLIINGDQAMPEGGKIEVTCRNRFFTENDLLAILPGNYVALTISDNGFGISPENLDKIFDPYFTTKEEGNGLGLAISHAIISKHQGNIVVKSELGVGTSFEIFLPAIDPTASETVEPSGAQLPAGSGRILVMDDEEMVCEATADLLDFLGYSISTAADGREALRLYQEALDRQEPIDIVILDLTVPGGMGGEECLRELRRLDPDVVGIATIGYCNNPVMSNYLDYGFKGVLPKPCKVEKMAQLIEELLKK